MPFVRGHRSVFPRTLRNTGVYTRHPTFVTATSGALTRLPEKLSKNGMRVYTLSDRRSEKKLRVYTASEAEGLRPETGDFFSFTGTRGCYKLCKPYYRLTHNPDISTKVQNNVLIIQLIVYRLNHYTVGKTGDLSVVLDLYRID